MTQHCESTSTHCGDEQNSNILREIVKINLIPVLGIKPKTSYMKGGVVIYSSIRVSYWTSYDDLVLHLHTVHPSGEDLFHDFGVAWIWKVP